MKMVVKRERERATEWVSESWMNNRTQWGEKNALRKIYSSKKLFWISSVKCTHVKYMQSMHEWIVKV